MTDMTLNALPKNFYQNDNRIGHDFFCSTWNIIAELTDIVNNGIIDKWLQI